MKMIALATLWIAWAGAMCALLYVFTLVHGHALKSIVPGLGVMHV
jgi:hypothetical protein